MHAQRLGVKSNAVAQVRNKMMESDVIKAIQEGKAPESACKPYRLTEETAKIYEAIRSGEALSSIAKVRMVWSGIA